MKLRTITTTIALSAISLGVSDAILSQTPEFVNMPNGNYFFVSDLSGQRGIAMIVRKVNRNTAIAFLYDRGMPRPSYICGKGGINQSSIVNVAMYPATFTNQGWRISQTRSNLRGPLHLNPLLLVTTAPEQNSVQGFQSCLRFFGNR